MKTNTINKEEIQKFSKIASEWWDPAGKYKPLHKFNPARLKYIKEEIVRHFNIKFKNKPLRNLNILDIGCGGGLISEPLARLGGKITGMDASQKNINVAKIHADKKLKINYICSSPEKINFKKKFDVILNLEVVEHVDNLNLFLNKSSSFLKKDGLMFISTINKTLKSYIFAIIGAEYVLRWLPIGTHDWEKFIEPNKLKHLCEKNYLKLKKTDGMVFNPLNDSWNIKNDDSVNYISVFKKV
tara:strand:+ start:180 stop:905 length:726 start_codon:yes stop_codon:yes gene_type:complete